MIFLFFLACILSFALGFMLGNLQEACVISKKERKRRAEIIRLREEFKNFLEYDGSEQL